MGLPGSKRTKISRNTRRSHDALKGIKTIACENCKAPILPHQACQFCGMYKGRKIIDTEKRATRRARKVKKFS